MDAASHKERAIARLHETDVDRRLRVRHLCAHMEEAAGNHAAALGFGVDALAAAGHAWALAKMRLCLNSLPGAGEPFLVETWPVAVERRQFRRDFIVYGAQENIHATAVTLWMPMGLVSRKLESFPEDIVSLLPSQPRVAQENGDIRIPPVGDGAPAGPAFPVRLADLDWNRHVNNGNYVDFVLEAADAAGMAGELKQIEIIFRAEALRGDVIATRSAATQDNPRACLHSLLRQSDGRELARARTLWRA